MHVTSRSIRLDLQFKLVNDKSPMKIAVLTVGDDEIAEWCLDLTLLRYGMLEEVLIIPVEGKTALQLRMEPELKKKYKKTRGRVTEQHGFIKLAVDLKELDGWLAFYLLFYRDGIGKVDHIDFDITTRAQGLAYDYFDMVLKIPRSEI